MVKKNLVVKMSTALIVGALLTGCGAAAEMSELNNLTALNTETETSTVRKLSSSDEEAAVYAQVSDRTLLDLTTLEQVNATDEAAVVNYMDSVDAQLCGTLSSADGVIDEVYVNYLLMEFEKTPWYWQRTSMNIRGMDASSRSIVVDMTYKTINFPKDAKRSSFISRGEPDYDKKMQVRYERWINILASKYGYGSSNWESDLVEFKEVYGEPDEIIDEQSSKSLAAYTYETGNQKTYSGLVDDDYEQSAATMTVRYILVPQYSLGINLGFNCEHMYLLNYTLLSDPTEGREVYNVEGSASIADSVYKLLYSYYQAEDEDNYDGLYSLVDDFASIDKYYTDYFDTTYRKHNNYTITLFSVQGTEIECGVNASVKMRAKGSNMTMPLYNQRWYYKMELVDGKLKITDSLLLSEELQGEPIINTEEAETSGFTATIVLTNQDKRDLESLIANFGAVQLQGDTTSDNFSDVVDTSISENQMSSLKENFNMFSGVRKVVWITSYLQGTTNYASIKCKELYQAADNSITETSVIYEFINKAGKWYIYDYNINSHAKLDSTDLTTKNSLCIVEPGEIVNLNSQVVSTSEDDTVTPAVVDVSTIGKVTEFTEYTPVLKSGTASTGLATSSSTSLSDDKFNEWITKLVEDNNLQRTIDVDELMNNYYNAPQNIQDSLKALVANYDNYYNNYINDSQYSNEKKSIESNFTEIMLDYQDELDAYNEAVRNNQQPSEGEDSSETEEITEPTLSSDKISLYRQIFGQLKGIM